MTRERPILFSAPMVRAILDGRKWQTRRIVNPQPTISDGRWTWPSSKCQSMVEIREMSGLGPYGGRGEHLWVKETWGLHAFGDETDWYRGSIRGLSGDQIQTQHKLAHRADWGPLQEGCFWRPSIFMPRWASRTLLEVTEVRVQRLQDISEDDARAEGVDEVKDKVPTARDAFRLLWESINGDRAPWASNPWVFAVSFRRLT